MPDRRGDLGLLVEADLVGGQQDAVVDEPRVGPRDQLAGRVVDRDGRVGRQVGLGRRRAPARAERGGKGEREGRGGASLGGKQMRRGPRKQASLPAKNPPESRAAAHFWLFSRGAGPHRVGPPCPANDPIRMSKAVRDMAPLRSEVRGARRGARPRHHADRGPRDLRHGGGPPQAGQGAPRRTTPDAERLLARAVAELEPAGGLQPGDGLHALLRAREPGRGELPDHAPAPPARGPRARHGRRARPSASRSRPP